MKPAIMFKMTSQNNGKKMTRSFSQFAVNEKITKTYSLASHVFANQMTAAVERSLNRNGIIKLNQPTERFTQLTLVFR